MDIARLRSKDLVLSAMIRASRLAGLKIRDAVSNRSQQQFKTKSNSSDLVTETDVQCQEAIVKELKKAFPDHKIVGEESDEGSEYSLTNDNTFIIDPIDGTSNFARGIPHCAVLISRSVKKRIDRAVVLDPFRLELFWAIEGEGSFLSALDTKTLDVSSNERKLSVNANVKTLREATVLTDCGYTRDALGVNKFIELQNQLLHVSHCRALRVLGSCGLGLAWVACGRADVYVERDGPLIWDFSGGDLLVREAGGVTMDPSGGEFDMTQRSVLVAANTELANQIVGCVKAADKVAQSKLAKM